MNKTLQLEVLSSGTNTIFQPWLWVFLSPCAPLWGWVHWAAAAPISASRESLWFLKAVPAPGLPAFSQSQLSLLVSIWQISHECAQNRNAAELLVIAFKPEEKLTHKPQNPSRQCHPAQMKSPLCFLV